MLVLSRKRGGVVRVGDHISIHVISINGNKIQLGIDAPEGVKILRAELCDSVDDAQSKGHPRHDETMEAE